MFWHLARHGTRYIGYIEVTSFQHYSIIIAHIIVLKNISLKMMIAFLSQRKYDKSQKRLDISFSCISKLLRLEKFFFTLIMIFKKLIGFYERLLTVKLEKQFLILFKKKLFMQVSGQRRYREYER